jgi:hypothetical protein
MFIGDFRLCDNCEREHYSDQGCNTILLKEIIELLKDR